MLLGMKMEKKFNHNKLVFSIYMFLLNHFRGELCSVSHPPEAQLSFSDRKVSGIRLSVRMW
jgi:hypothetical protein